VQAAVGLRREPPSIGTVARLLSRLLSTFDYCSTMLCHLLTLTLGALVVVANAARNPSITTAPTPTLAERQIAFSSISYTACTIHSGLAVPQPAGALCGLDSAPVQTQSSQLIKKYTDVDSTTSYIVCSQLCLATPGCTQIFFAAGATCSLYSGVRLYAEGPSTLSYYDVACFECYQAPLSTSSSRTREPSASTTRASPRSTVKVSITTTTTPASSISPSNVPVTTWTSVQTNPGSYDMAMTTVFTPAPECTGSFTQIGTNYWQNAIIPAPHITLPSCYPSQFYSSVVGAANSVSLPPFSPLVCPSGWSDVPYNSTYFVCCPE
jgi:hypothetical protein